VHEGGRRRHRRRHQGRARQGREAALTGKRLDAAAIEAAAAKAADGVDVQADLQGSVEYKAHLCRVFAKRALRAAVKARAGIATTMGASAFSRGCARILLWTLENLF